MRLGLPWLVIGLSSSVPVAGADAEVVRIVGPAGFGQGWMFLDQDGGCKVVTAAHVVLGQGEKTPPILILTQRGWELTPATPYAVFAVLDIAVMGVPCMGDPALCGTGRLSAVGAERRARHLTDGYISRMNQSEVVDVPVESRALSTGDGDARFAVRPTLPSDTVASGWSGSVVMDGDGPVGTVTNKGDGNEALAVRVDAIRQAMGRASPGAPPPVHGDDGPSYVVSAGHTPDPGRGPGHVADGGGPGWEVEPRRGTVVVTVNFGRPVHVHVAGLEAVGERNAIEAVSLATSSEWSGPMIDVNRCVARTGEARVTCGFAPRTIRTLRYVITTRGDAQIGLRRLEVH